MAATPDVAVLAFLRDHGVDFVECRHPPVFTVDEAARLVPLDAGARAKNLYVAGRRGDRRFLVVVPYAKSVDLKRLGEHLGVGRLSLGGEADLAAHLGVGAGAVSLLALLADPAGAVTAVIDAVLWQASAIQMHPMVNTATLAVPRAGLAAFLRATGHDPVVLDVPARDRVA
jgi:Ala-tRNA(Pro) deacylase